MGLVERRREGGREGGGVFGRKERRLLVLRREYVFGCMERGRSASVHRVKGKRMVYIYSKGD